MRRGRGNRSLPDIRTRLQCFLASLLEGALFALLVGVAPNQMACASREPLPVETPVETQQKERTAEELMSLLEARWSAWKAMFCAIAVLLHHLVVAGYWLMFAPDSPIVTAIFATMFGAAFGAGIVSLPLGWLFARLESQFTPRDGTQGLSFG